jgi:dTDP-4-amino-4,6-dideoxygalactose transaminase
MIQYSHPNFTVDESLKNWLGDILDGGWVSIGTYTNQLEETVADRFKVKHVIACANATTGLIIALKAAGITNLKIEVPAFTWPSTIYALVCNGNTPIYTDIKKDTWTIDTTTQRYVLPVDTFGASAGKYANAVYDAAHAWDVPDLGHRGIAEVLSLSFTKVVTATEGGLILTNDDEVAETCRELRRLSGRLEEVNAFIALRSIDYWDTEAKEHRQYLVNSYKKAFDFNFSVQEGNINNSVFSIVLPTPAMRDKILKELSLKQIETKIYYEPLIDGLETTDYIYSQSIALPLNRFITDEQIKEIADIANMAVKGCPGKDYLNRYIGRI